MKLGFDCFGVKLGTNALNWENVYSVSKHSKRFPLDTKALEYRRPVGSGLFLVIMAEMQKRFEFLALNCHFRTRKSVIFGETFTEIFPLLDCARF
jgi:hypothetical protein